MTFSSFNNNINSGRQLSFSVSTCGNSQMFPFLYCAAVYKVMLNYSNSEVKTIKVL